MSEPADWPKILAAQGVGEAVIARAKTNAEAMANVAGALPQDTLTPIVPDDLVAALLADLKSRA